MVNEIIEKAKKAIEIKDLYNLEGYLEELRIKKIFTEEVYILEAKLLLEKHHISEALKLINKILQKNENNMEALKIKGKLCSCIGNKDGAYNTYKKMINLDSKNTEIKFLLGRASLNLNKYEEGREIYKDIFHNTKSDEVTGYFQSCNRYIVKELSEKLDELNDNEIISIAKGKYYLGNLNESEELLLSIPNYYDNYDALIYLANIYRIKEKFKKAIEYCDRLIELEPNNAKGVFNKGIILEEVFKVDDALDNYKLALEIDPNYRPIYNKLISLMIRSNKEENLIELMDKSLNLEYDYEISLLNKGMFLEKENNYDEAMDYYDKAINHFPRYVDAYVRKIYLYIKNKSYQEAFEISEKAIDLCYQDYKIAIMKSLILFQIGQYSNALEWIEWALEDKKCYQLYYFKSLYLCELSEYSEAMESIDEAIKLRKEDIINWCLKIYINSKIGIKNYSEIIHESCSKEKSIEGFIKEISESISLLKLDDTYKEVINILKND